MTTQQIQSAIIITTNNSCEGISCRTCCLFNEDNDSISYCSEPSYKAGSTIRRVNACIKILADIKDHPELYFDSLL